MLIYRYIAAFAATAVESEPIKVTRKRNVDHHPLTPDDSNITGRWAAPVALLPEHVIKRTTR